MKVAKYLLGKKLINIILIAISAVSVPVGFYFSFMVESYLLQFIFLAFMFLFMYLIKENFKIITNGIRNIQTS